MLGGTTYEEREARSEERLAAHVHEVGWGTVVAGQTRKLGLLLFRTPSFFERALTERWGDPPPSWLAALRPLGRGLWLALLVLGPLAALLRARRSPADLLLLGFVLYYAVAVLAIPYKVRFLVQLFPVLALLTAALLGDGWRALRERRARS
jgi:hypothetical protein